MESWSTTVFVDERGRPFEEPLQQALHNAYVQLRREFTPLRDDTDRIDVVEEAGRRIRDRDRERSDVNDFEVYVWTSVSNAAKSRLRRNEMRLVRGRLDPEATEEAFGELVAVHGTQEQIENGIFEREILASLNEDERCLLHYKEAGRKALEIAAELGISVIAVHVRFHRLKRKVRRLLAEAAPKSTSPAAQPGKVRPMPT